MNSFKKIILVFAATIAIIPTAQAQTANPEKYNESNGVGYNKYLTSSTPNEDGEYTLRLETFITGEVKKYAVPTDFALVLDVSGSMLYDYRLASTTLPSRIAFTTNDARDETHPLKLVEDKAGDMGDYGFCYWSFNRMYKTGTIGAVDSSSGSAWKLFQYKKDDGTTYTPNITRYIKYPSDGSDGYFYRLYGEIVKDGNTKYYEIYFNRYYKPEGSTEYKTEKRYLHINKTTHKYQTKTTPYKEATSANQIILASNLAGSGVSNLVLYRPQQRREALMRGLTTFLDAIQAENAKDQWHDGQIKHQVAMVRFGNDNATTTTAVVTSKGKTPAVIQGFTQVTSGNVGTMKTLLNSRTGWNSSTWINHGMRLGYSLLRELQAQPGMAPLNPDKSVNRNKVVVVFTDGEPSSYTEDAMGTWTSPGNTTYKFWGKAGTAMVTNIYGYYTKKAWTSATGTALGAKIYAIDLSAEPNSSTFLQHLSSNYTDGRVTNKAANYRGNWDVIKYMQTTPTTSGYYFDASNSDDLSAVFQTIADETTGQNAGSNLVMVDAMSDSFVIPENVNGKVKFYTAQCIGTKTIDGQEYLAFAKEIEAPARGNIADLWCPTVNSSGNQVWVNKGSNGDGTLADIDGTASAPKISYTVSADGKKIVFKGFPYVELFCGYDGTHSNTRHTVSSTDPNYVNQKTGYRGFKLIAEFPIVLEENAVGGPDVATNNPSESGLFNTNPAGDPTGTPIINFPVPDVPVPVSFTIYKSGLGIGESASFTVQRRLAENTSSTYTDYVSFIITEDGTNDPEVKLLNLDPAYHYCIKETGWSWSYTIDNTVYATEEGAGLTQIETNPIVFTNSPKSETVKHGEAVANNVLHQ